MAWFWRCLVAVLASLLVDGQASEPMAPPLKLQTLDNPGPSKPPASTEEVRETPGLQATQVSVAVDREGSRRRFRASVIRADGDLITILTAAHCIAEADQGWPVALLFGGGVVVEGVVESVARNPLYRPNQLREIPGPDNAVARLRFRVIGDLGPIPPTRFKIKPTVDPAAIEAFRSLRSVTALTNRFYPGPGGRSVDVRMVDGRGVEHAVLAGNHSNPRWLEWGKSYQPIPGDSGGGVFVVRPGPNGQPRPILIGTIVGRDDRGGGASLISLDQPWVSEALSPPTGGS